LPILLAAAEGRLNEVTAKWSNDKALTIVMAAEGYPDAPKKGSVIRGLGAAALHADVRVFHAGTALQGAELIANGGRVLNVTATGSSVRAAQERAYAAVDEIDWPEGFCRGDIGWREVEREL
jgi:phosphoribosylamine---glycine ligase